MTDCSPLMRCQLVMSGQDGKAPTIIGVGGDLVGATWVSRAESRGYASLPGSPLSAANTPGSQADKAMVASRVHHTFSGNRIVELAVLVCFAAEFPAQNNGVFFRNVESILCREGCGKSSSSGADLASSVPRGSHSSIRKVFKAKQGSCVHLIPCGRARAPLALHV